ncbi:MAG: putative glycoside hydrolase, partial [Candidatus Nealsonbacteria bacterium]
MKISNFAIFLIFSAFLSVGFGSFLFSEGGNISRNYEITISREKKEIPEKEIPIKEETENKSSIKEEPIKAVYITSWSASRSSYIYYLVSLALSTEINAVVIDIKDFSGYVAYDSKLSQVKEYSAKQVRIKDLEGLIEKLHGAGLYVIARITVFQDPRLALARPILGIHSKEKLDLEAIPVFSKITLWKDRSGLAWIDPAAKEAWEYNAAIAKEAISLGF